MPQIPEGSRQETESNDGITLTLIPSGWTYERTFVRYDRQTNSFWYPYEKGLMGIHGVFIPPSAKS